MSKKTQEVRQKLRNDGESERKRCTEKNKTPQEVKEQSGNV